MALARVMYEGTHGLSLAELSEKTGIPKRQLTIYSRDGEWRKLLETKTGITTDAAKEAALKFAGQAVERATAVAQTAEQIDQSAHLLTEPLPTEREALLARHRKEWNVPRTLSVQAMQLAATDPMRAFERAKLAKITSENLTLVQNGERKAHGIDKADGNHTVVVERIAE